MNKAEFHALLQSISAFDRSIDNLDAMMDAGIDRDVSGPLRHELDRIRSTGSTAVVRAMRSVWSLTITPAEAEIRRIEQSTDPDRVGQARAVQKLILEMVTARDGSGSKTDQ